jgi:hypothetical protein
MVPIGLEHRQKGNTFLLEHVPWLNVETAP